jgi:hypothetical protein
MKRRSFLIRTGAFLACIPSVIDEGLAATDPVSANLLSAPMELGAAWGGSQPNDARAVVFRMRKVCLSGIRLLSDRQPAKLHVEDQSSGPPHIWLHDDQPDAAWIVVDIGTRDWCKLAYQFGHELGHVLCNSWQRQDKPRLPSQWLEEALVEAFSIHGLGLLADSWERRPPFPHDEAFGGAIRKYRQDLIERYRAPTGALPAMDMCSWLRRNRDLLDHTGGVGLIEGPAILQILAEYQREGACVEDLGAVNRWPARGGVQLEEYLTQWRASCSQIQAAGRLPMRLQNRFCLG